MDCSHKLSRLHNNLNWPLYLVHHGSTELDLDLSSKLSTRDANRLISAQLHLLHNLDANLLLHRIPKG